MKNWSDKPGCKELRGDRGTFCFSRSFVNMYVVHMQGPEGTFRYMGSMSVVERESNVALYKRAADLWAGDPVNESEYQRALRIVKEHYAGMNVDVDAMRKSDVVATANAIELGWD